MTGEQNLFGEQNLPASQESMQQAMDKADELFGDDAGAAIDQLLGGEDVATDSYGNVFARYVIDGGDAEGTPLGAKFDRIDIEYGYVDDPTDRRFTAPTLKVNLVGKPFVEGEPGASQLVVIKQSHTLEASGERFDADGLNYSRLEGTSIFGLDVADAQRIEGGETPSEADRGRVADIFANPDQLETEGDEMEHHGDTTITQQNIDDVNDVLRLIEDKRAANPDQF